MNLIIADDKQKLKNELGKLITTASKAEPFFIGVSGGSLAKILSEVLPDLEVDFSKWRIFFCDERIVPVNNPDSTFGLYKKNLIESGAVSLEESQFIQIKQNVNADEAAIDYENQLRKFFPDTALPRFDMLLLGMGPDGHICSLFPQHPLLKEETKWIAPITDSPKPPLSRVTMTLPVVNNAKKCVFVVTGKEKADVVKRILVDKEDFPATRVLPSNGNVHWILDKEAGELVKHLN